MKIQFVGSGSAFNKTDGQSNAVVIADSGKKLLIDCGSYFWFMAQKTLMLYKSGAFIGEVYNPNIEVIQAMCDQFDVKVKETDEYTPDDFDGIYISHLHADHVGGLEEVAFSTFFNPAAPKPKLFGNFRLMHDLWEQSVRGGLESIQAQQMDLDSYFDVMRIPDNGEFIWEGIAFKPVQTVHVVNDCTIKFSYGLLIRDGMQWGNDKKDTVSIGKPQPTVFFTTDTQHSPNQIKDFYRRSDLIFHDCETSPFQSGVHAHYSELTTLDPEVRAKMILYHNQPNPPQRQLMDIEPRTGADGELQSRMEQVKVDGFINLASKNSVYDVSWESIKDMQEHLSIVE